MPTFARQALPSSYRYLRRQKNRLLNLMDPPVVVLVYHRVTTPRADPHLLAVSPINFRAQMAFLKENFQLVRFEDNWSGLTAPAVAVTFDDGYADNFLQALPILEEAGVPATFFVTTGALGSQQEFWWDELERLLLSEMEYPPLFRLEDREHGREWSTNSREERLAMHNRFHLLLKQSGATRRENWLEQLRTWAGLERSGREANRPLTPEQLQAMAASPLVTIGAHGVTHTSLAVLSEEEQRQEIFSSRQLLRQLLGWEVVVFSYPFGTRYHYNRISVRLCREAGFRRVAANFPGQAHRWTDNCQIPRQLVRNWDLETFSAMIMSFRA